MLGGLKNEATTKVSIVVVKNGPKTTLKTRGMIYLGSFLTDTLVGFVLYILKTTDYKQDHIKRDVLLAHTQQGCNDVV